MRGPRALGALLAAVALLGVPVGDSARAQPSPSPVTLSDVRLEDGALRGLLTLAAGERDPQLVRSTLRLTVAGRTYVPDVTRVTTQRRATMIVVDTSGSMTADDMATIRGAVAAFLAAAPRDVLVGVVAFSGAARLVVPPGRDRAAVRRAVDSLRPGGETALYDAVALAVARLGSTGDRSLLLLGDGGDTASSTSRAAAARRLHAAGVRAEVIAFRTSETDTHALAEVASAGGGRVAAAGDAAAVTTAFRAAARALDAQVALTVTPRDPLTGTETVTVTGRTPSGAFRTGADVVVDPGTGLSPTPTPSAQPAPATPPAPPAPGPHPVSGPPGSGTPVWALTLALVAVFVGVLLIALAVLAPALASPRRRRVEDIDRLLAPRERAAPSPSVVRTPSALGQNIVGIGDRVMEGRSATPRTMRLLQRADLPWRPGEWLVLRVVAVVAGTAAGLVLLGPLPWALGAVGGALAGLLGPAAGLRLWAARRAKRFESQLPEVLTLVASSLQSGFSLIQALDAVARDGVDPTAKEVSRALAEVRIGTDIEEALERVGDRMGSTNMEWTAMAIGIQRSVGGNLAETLRTTAATLRDREALRGQVRALSAEGRLSAGILVALPVGVFFYLLWVNPEYLSLLWTRVPGILMLLGGGVFLVVGVLWMRKVVEVEV